ncbi:c-type cytochrome [Azospirillum himalayense]|uniref:C-type cytochrome n=1 Tax=Azospirillum himalayense TaxID=654847 RepID=A0ABW0GBD8_9PROT
MVDTPCRLPSLAVGAIIVSSIVAASAHAASDGPGSIGFGRHLAEEVCGECHRVSQPPTAKPPPMQEELAAPDLVERMRDPGVTEMALRSYLRTSHPVMPNIRLSMEETDDVVAYLMSLKEGLQ